MALDMEVGFDPVARRVVILRKAGSRVIGQIAALTVSEGEELERKLHAARLFAEGIDPAVLPPVPEATAEFGTHPEPMFDVEQSPAREAMEHPERYEVVRGPQGVAQLRRKPGA